MIQESGLHRRVVERFDILGRNFKTQGTDLVELILYQTLSEQYSTKLH